MKNFRKFWLLPCAVLLLGCAETSTGEYDLKGYQAASWQWSAVETQSPEIAQNTGAATATTVSSVQAAENPRSADETRMRTAAIIAVVGLIALILIADDASACSGSGCGGGGGGISIN